MRARLYLETTIPSYYVARPSKNAITAARQKVTHHWWAKRLRDFEVFISDVVIDEVALGEPAMAKRRLELLKPFPRLAATSESEALTETLLTSGVLPAKASRDAAHIAVSAAHAMHFLLTWNCRHIANAELLRKEEEVCRNHGFQCPVVCTPDELMGA
ncbi:MAG: type II toxin-antitoxin system VapC family toxin [Verrucomicrobia bacterium]|nr:type II toxin-antitoxin system VapC family toxin [Verrucomicrobiota bacterium]